MPKIMLSNSRTLSSLSVVKKFEGLVSAFHKKDPLIINFPCGSQVIFPDILTLSLLEQPKRPLCHFTWFNRL